MIQLTRGNGEDLTYSHALHQLRPRHAVEGIAQQVRTVPSKKGFEEANGGWRANGADDAIARERAERGYTSFSDKPLHFATRSRAYVCLARGHSDRALARCVREGWGGGDDASGPRLYLGAAFSDARTLSS